MSRDERLTEWIESLDIRTLRSIAFEVIDRMIDIEELRMWEDTKVPYWESDGERLDGSERDEEE